MSDQRPAADGKGAVSRFVRGSIHAHPDTGVHAVWGGIGEKWVALGWETGPLGYPAADQRAVPGGAGSDNDFVGAGTAATTTSSVPGRQQPRLPRSTPRQPPAPTA